MLCCDWETWEDLLTRLCSNNLLHQVCRADVYTRVRSFTHMYTHARAISMTDPANSANFSHAPWSLANNPIQQGFPAECEYKWRVEIAWDTFWYILINANTKLVHTTFHCMTDWTIVAQLNFLWCQANWLFIGSDMILPTWTISQLRGGMQTHTETDEQTHQVDKHNSHNWLNLEVSGFYTKLNGWLSL